MEDNTFIEIESALILSRVLIKLVYIQDMIIINQFRLWLSKLGNEKIKNNKTWYLCNILVNQMH